MLAPFHVPNPSGMGMPRCAIAPLAKSMKSMMMSDKEIGSQPRTAARSIREFSLFTCFHPFCKLPADDHEAVLQRGLKTIAV